MDKYCRKCGKEISPNDEFCRKCGKTIMPQKKVNRNKLIGKYLKRNPLLLVCLIAIMVLIFVSVWFLIGGNSITVDELLDNSMKYDGEKVTVRGYLEKDYSDDYKLWNEGKTRCVEICWGVSGIEDLEDYAYIEITGEFAYYEYIDSTIYPDYNGLKVLE